MPQASAVPRSSAAFPTRTPSRASAVSSSVRRTMQGPSQGDPGPWNPSLPSATKQPSSCPTGQPERPGPTRRMPRRARLSHHASVHDPRRCSNKPSTCSACACSVPSTASPQTDDSSSKPMTHVDIRSGSSAQGDRPHRRMSCGSNRLARAAAASRRARAALFGGAHGFFLCGPSRLGTKQASGRGRFGAALPGAGRCVRGVRPAAVLRGFSAPRKQSRRTCSWCEGCGGGTGRGTCCGRMAWRRSGCWRWRRCRRTCRIWGGSGSCAWSRGCAGTGSSP